MLARSGWQLRLHQQRGLAVLIGHLQVKLFHGLDAVTSPLADDLQRMMQHQVSRSGCSKILECFLPRLQMGALDNPMQLSPQFIGLPNPCRICGRLCSSGFGYASAYRTQLPYQPQSSHSTWCKDWAVTGPFRAQFACLVSHSTQR